MEFDAKEEIKSKLNIVDVLSSYIQVHKAGTNYKACCPFHNEKTPSFFISPQRQIWHCFGCNKTGDIFTFVMNIENVDFITALKILADKAGVRLPRFDTKINSQNKTMYNALEDAISLYQKNLQENKTAMDYLLKRGLTSEIISEFKLGFSLDTWNDCITNLLDKGYQLKDLSETGLFIQKNEGNSSFTNNNFYDRFRSRIMFPIYNNSNEPVAFTARIFEGTSPLKTIKNIDETGKYVNSPQTKVYEKGKILYGLNITKRYISQQNEAIVVEGTMDFLSAYLKGNKNIVASLGTALTLDQLTLLKRLCNRLILAYDNDEAGKMATERNIKLALGLDFQLKILDLEDSKDISDFINDNPTGLDEKIKNSLPAMDFYIKHGLSLYNTNLLNGKNDFLRYFLPKLKWEKDIIKISHYLNTLSNTLDIRLEVLEETFKKTISEEIEDEHFKKIKEDLKPQNLDLLKTKSETLSEVILSIFVQKPIILKNLVIDNSEFFNFKYQDFLNLVKQNGLEVINDQTIDPGIKETIDYLFLISPKYENLIGNDDTTILKEINNYLTLLKQEHFKSRMQSIQNELKTAESTNDMVRVNELINELNTICTNLNKLN
jgi:DNA primase